MAEQSDTQTRTRPVVHSNIKAEDLKKENDEDDDFRATQNKQHAEEGILMIAYYLQKNDLSLRAMFGDFLYDETIEEAQDKKKEFEMISIREFSQIVKGLMGLDEKHI